MSVWQPIDTAPFESAKRYLLAHNGGVTFIGWRYYADGPWIAEHMNLKDNPPNHWAEIPDAPNE